MYIYALAQKHDSITSSVFEPVDKVTLNLGLGFEVGGIGINVNYYPIKNLGLFAGVGYAFTNMGYSAGTKLRWLRRDSLSVVAPYIIAMYGYYASIKVKNADHYNKTFYGPSIGIGIDSPAKNGIYWSFALLKRIDNGEVDDYVKHLEKNGVIFKQTPLPINLSITFRTIIS